VPGKAGRRYLRTFILGLLALAALLWMAVEQFGIATRDLLLHLGAAALTVLLVIAAAALCTAVGLVFLRWLRSRGGD